MVHRYTIKEPKTRKIHKTKTRMLRRARAFALSSFLLVSCGPSGVFLRPEWTAIVLARILKLLGGHRSRELRLVSKQTRDTIESVYSMAFQNAAPLISVHGPGITNARLTRVRSILTGPNGPNGTLGANNATISLTCDAKGPCADETYAIRDHLAVHPNDTVELVVSGDFMIARGHPRSWSASLLPHVLSLRALRAWISKARFTYCTLNEWHVHALADFLPPSLRSIEFDGCTFQAPIDQLINEFRCVVHVGIGCCESRFESRVRSFPPLEWLTRRRDTLETLDLSGITSLARDSPDLIYLLTFAKKIRTLNIGSSLRFVHPDLARALLSSHSLRELHAGRCTFTFAILRDACDAISAKGRQPAPALEILDLSENKNIGTVPSAVAFLRSVPSLKEIFLQETGVPASILTEAPNKAVVFHLSFASLGAEQQQIARAPVHWHRYPHPR